MGCFCSCLKGGSGGANSSKSETELTSKNGATSKKSALAISRSMSAPSVLISGCTVSGAGLALTNVTVEQDAAYWEWHIKCVEGKSGDEDDEDEEGDGVMFGVATKKSREFYRALQRTGEEDEITPEQNGTALMKTIPSLQDGDTIGVAVQQSDLPMVQFLLNGEPLHELAINRFRGAVYPSVKIREGIEATIVFEEDDFREMSPHARFGPLIAARGII